MERREVTQVERARAALWSPRERDRADVMDMRAHAGTQTPSWGPNSQTREGLAFASLQGLGTGQGPGGASAGVGPLSTHSWRTGFPS